MADTATRHRPLGLDLERERDRSYGIEPDASRISRIPIGSIRPDPEQPRKTFDPDTLRDLADSMASSTGQIQPIVVRDDPEAYDRYLIIAGERRWRAAQLAALEMIDAIVKPADRAAEIQLVENLQREDLKPLEEAFAFKRYMDERDLTQAQMAKAVGKRQSSISEILSLTTLPDAIREALPSHPQIPKSQLVLIAKERDGARQLQLWEEATRGTLTVQRARALANERAARPRRAASRRGASPVHTLTRAIESGGRELAKVERITPAERKRLEAAIEQLREILAGSASA